MAIAPIGGAAALLPSLPTLPQRPTVPEPGFGAALARGLEGVSALEHRADALIQDAATGGATSIQDVMVATTQSALAVDMLVAVRDRAMESYHEIMRMQL